jgi:hypothetical protein
VEQLAQTTTDRLSSHDQVLTAVSKLAPKTHVAVQHSVSPQTIDKWCRHLVALRAQETKSRIDAIFLNEVLEHSDVLQNGHDAETTAERDELQAELKSLQDEIASVAEVVVAHEMRQPLLRYMRASTFQAKEDQKDWVGYIVSTMQHMIRQLDVLHEHGMELHAYDSALRAIQDAFHEALIKASEPNKHEGQTRTRKASTPVTPTASGSRRPDRAVDQALRRFNITTSSSAPTLSTALSAAVSSSCAKLQDQYDSAETLDLEALGKSLGARDRDLQAIINKLYANSEFATIRLSEKRLDDMLQSLDEKIAAQASVYGRVDSERRHEGVPVNVEGFKKQWTS